MSLFRPIAASDPLISLSELKTYLKIENDLEDKMLKRLAVNATSAIEKSLGQYILETTVQSRFVAEVNGDYTLNVDQGPLVSVEVEVEDTNGIVVYPQFRIDTKNRSMAIYGIRFGDSVVIDAKVGLYSDPDLVDGMIIQAIFVLASYWYEARDAADIPASVLSMIRPYKVYGL